MDLHYESTVKPSLRSVESHPAVHDVTKTAGAMVSDWFVELEPLPGDLVVPNVVFRAVREADAKITSIKPTVDGNWSVSGGYHGSEPEETNSLQDLEAAPEVQQTHSHNHSRAHVELVVDEPSNMLFFKIERAPYLVYNLQKHESREGWSLYLTDSEQLTAEPRTLDELLEEQSR